MSDSESGARHGESGSGRSPASGRARGWPRIVAFGFLLAFAATVLTVILTGLMLRG